MPFKIRWKSNAEVGRPQTKIWCMRNARWIPKDTNTHSEYVILVAFPLQELLHERASMLRYTNAVCIVTKEDTSKLATMSNHEPL